MSATFAANHTAARVAFDHGASVGTGVLTRATGTTLVLLVMMKLQGVSFALSRQAFGRATIMGLLIASQSYCIYSAIKVIPAALALLVFQTSPMLFVLVSWASGKEAPRRSAFLAILLSLAGLALALGLGTRGVAAQWAVLGEGILWALGACLSFTIVLYANAHWLKGVDGRLRTLVMTGTTAVVVLAASAATDILALPRDGMGWLGLGLLTALYCTAMCTLFITLPRVDTVSTVALNFEPIALLGLAWLFLGQTISPLQIVGAIMTVAAIAWLGLLKR